MTPDYEYKGKCHIRFFNCDNMEFMKEVEDKYDLAIVDPPYGLGKKLKPRGGMIGKSFNGMGEHSWDAVPPKKEYWKALFMVSKNQIVWGGNYFIDFLKPTQCFLIWDKMNGTNPMADCEFAWTSIENKVARIFSMHHFSAGYEDKIHPTQKPTKLYRWTLKQFATQGMKIIDTHGGSMTLARAAYEEGFDLDIMELDKEYFDKGVLAFKQHVSQQKLF